MVRTLLFLMFLIGFLDGGAAQKPTIQLESYNDKNTVRPSDSNGGLVNGVDKFTMYATVTRNNGSAENYPEDGIVAQLRGSNTGGWGDLKTCKFDLNTCGPQTSDCHCQSVTIQEDVYTLAIGFTADASLSSASLRLVWSDVTSNEVQLPQHFCESVKVSYKLGTVTLELIGGGPYSVTKPEGTATPKFCATGLEGHDFIKIEVEGSVLSSSRTDSCAVTTVDDSHVGKDFTLAFQESATDGGCGRTGSYILGIKGTEKTKEDKTLEDVVLGVVDSPEKIVGVVIGVVVGVVIVIVVLVIVFFACFRN